MTEKKYTKTKRDRNHTNKENNEKADKAPDSIMLIKRTPNGRDT